jgi:haloalkane dehalogenase
MPDMKTGELLGRSCRGLLSKAECDAYDAPYPSLEYKGGVRRFPNLVMINEEMEGVDISKNSRYFYETADQFKDIDVFMACRIKDPVLGQKTMEKYGSALQNRGKYVMVLRTYAVGGNVDPDVRH